MPDQYRIFPLGDSALLVQFGNSIDSEVNQKVLSLFQQLQRLSPFVKEVVPAYSSLAVYYDVLSLHSGEQSAFEKMKSLLQPLLQEANTVPEMESRVFKIPVCYTGHHAPDIKELAQLKDLSVEDVIGLHTAKSYRVYMIGFLPGFPYMGIVDSRIATPRRSSPRTNIPAGSVGIAGEQTGIYSLPSPGGWNIIGRTPLTLFNPEKNSPALLQPGDSVTFYSITEDEFENYQSRTT